MGEYSRKETALIGGYGRLEMLNEKLLGEECVCSNVSSSNSSPLLVKRKRVYLTVCVSARALVY